EAVPAESWFFAEGSAQGGSTTTLALVNPGSEAASVEIALLPEGGGDAGAPRTVQVPPRAKLTVPLTGAALPARFGLALTASKPIVAQRSMTFGPNAMGTH